MTLPPDPARSEVRVRGQGFGTPHPVTLNILEGINVRGSALRNDLKLDAHLDIGSGDGLSGLSIEPPQSLTIITHGVLGRNSNLDSLIAGLQIILWKSVKI